MTLLGNWDKLPKAFSIVRTVSKEEFGIRDYCNSSCSNSRFTWNIAWTEPHFTVSCAHALLKDHKRCPVAHAGNHRPVILRFPNAYLACQKCRFERSLRRLAKLLPPPGAVRIAPETFLLPSEVKTLSQAVSANQSPFAVSKAIGWIYKPDAGSQGNGICLYPSSPTLTEEHDLSSLPAGVFQRYVAQPMLYDGHKFDLRAYVVAADLDRVFLFPDALVRCAPALYSPDNCQDADAHLTNTSRSSSAHKSKLLLSRLNELKSKIQWSRIELLAWYAVRALYPELLACSALSCSSKAAHANPSFVQLFGLDIVLCADGTPLLLEINNSPSLRIECPADVQIKSEVAKFLLSIASGYVSPAAVAADGDPGTTFAHDRYVTWCRNCVEAVFQFSYGSSTDRSACAKMWNRLIEISSMLLGRNSPLLSSENVHLSESTCTDLCRRARAGELDVAYVLDRFLRL